MAIQWFPGHMHKARKEMSQVLPETDVIIEVLDARIPYSSQNPMLAQIRGNKPCLKVLTKSDLADPESTQVWLNDLNNSDHSQKAIAISSQDAASIKTVPQAFRSMVNLNTNRVKPFCVMIVGIPNVGKSTLINLLAGKTIAKTGNEPAVTKRQQHITLSDHWILRDTPGVLWPNVENPDSGFRLAATGAIRDTAMDSAEVACYLLDYLGQTYHPLIEKRFNTELPTEGVEMLEQIGKLRGCIGGGQLVDFDRAARLVLTEFRSGLLGQLTLETPSMRDTELEQVVIASQKRAAEKENKAKRRKAARNKRT